jgi:glycosyltransferase involved in cell wall biosynthesis
MTSPVETGPVEVSCVVPAYNSVPLLARTLMSIVTQSGVTPEVVVVDDSTEPGVRAFVEGLAGLYPNLLYCPGARTGNPVDNWNAGLDRVTGRYQMVVHHDDFFCDPGCLRRAVDRLAAGEGEVLAFGHGLAGRAGPSRFGLASALARGLKLKPWSLYAINWIGPPAAVMFPAEPAIRFDPRLCWLVDVDFYARLLRPGVRLIRDEAVCLVSLRHADQITARIDTHLLKLREIRLLWAVDPDRLGPWRALSLAYAACRVAPWQWRLSRVSPAPPTPNATARTDS